MTESQLTDFISNYKFDDLIVISSMLSVIDVNEDFPKGDFFYSPLINNAKNNILTKTIVKSKSNYLSKDNLDENAFIKIYNSVSSLSDNQDLLNREDLSQDEKLKQYFSFMLTSQSVFTSNPIAKIAIMKYMLDIYPREYESELILKHKNNYFNISDFINEKLGFSLNDYLILSIYIGFIMPKLIYDEFFLPDTKTQGYLNQLKKKGKQFISVQQKLVLSHIKKIKLYYYYLNFSNIQSFFSKQYLSLKLPFISRKTIDNFLNLTSINLKNLRDLQKRDIYNYGHLAQQISPLLNKPILKLSTPTFIVPNYRFYQSSISEIIRLEINDNHLVNGFNEMLGTLFEKLILHISQELSDKLQIIEEKVYTKNKTDFRGPDLILIDKGRPILIETKLAQLKVTARINPFGEHLDDQLNTLYKAICKLEEKYLDLYEHEYYENTRNFLRDKNDIQPIFVGILYHGVEVMQEKIIENKRKNINHPLNCLNKPHIFLDAEHFLRVVEISKTHEVDLYDLLYEYWEIGNVTSKKDYSADSFKMRSYNNKNSFSKRVYDDLILSIRSV